MAGAPSKTRVVNVRVLQNTHMRLMPGKNKKSHAQGVEAESSSKLRHGKPASAHNFDVCFVRPIHAVGWRQTNQPVGPCVAGGVHLLPSARYGYRTCTGTSWLRSWVPPIPPREPVPVPRCPPPWDPTRLTPSSVWSWSLPPMAPGPSSSTRSTDSTAIVSRLSRECLGPRSLGWEGDLRPCMWRDETATKGCAQHRPHSTGTQLKMSL